MRIYRKKDRKVYEDDRGVIDELLPKGTIIRSVAYITGTTGAVRGNHLHKKDEHYCFILGGRIRYEWILNGKKQSVILQSGDLVYTPVNELHKFVFETEGIFLALAIRDRAQKNYEGDLVRKPF